jgi:hypothetical protein
LFSGSGWPLPSCWPKGEAARQQVLTALRITSRALNQMNAKLAAHGRAAQE